ncbi:hypothetical protein CW676_07715 [Macrococcoides caseolyticum]|uniref:hypothetical protein n=1 Tax=Macrococcoides caseolyticum TaxID=69966 RepID=UPI000C31FCAB|nr:hypothetical protein [Macrococcus caseolyticus]PKE06418.1 hypothetical protein CW692_08265 [Macrococcus caseolyticus]PKE23541.1 hypothetical protein CW689_08345 [Macrococcus caseolyticus]PKE52879.1 hypothetical protein CW676_07715 [Macrococcus caseolyticus]PKF37873.1 hypothetical protein CW681_09600 [Macrococcus caseolyticus]PKF44407.1 hypothetical protein CW664_11080 [Macrococcus caseolyticus]
MTQNIIQGVDDALKDFYEQKEHSKTEAIQDNLTDDPVKEKTSQNETPLFKSKKSFSDLEVYFKDSIEYLNEVFTRLGDGRLSDNLSSEDREELIKMLEEYKESMVQKVQDATIQLSNDIISVKKNTITSNVDTSQIFSLKYGSSDFKPPYTIDNNIFTDPE